MTIVALLGTLTLWAATPLPAAEATPVAGQAPNSAEGLFRDALKAYDAHKFERAIELFQAAYGASPMPEILFDIGQAYSALEDCQHAVESFEAFIAAAPPDHSLVARARARRERLGTCGGALASAASTGPSSTPSAIVPVAAQPGPSEPVVQLSLATPSPARGKGSPSVARTTALLAGGTSLVLGVFGVVFGEEALSEQRTVEGAPTWTQEVARADERGRTLGEVSTVLLISAGVAAGIAVVSYLLR